MKNISALVPLAAVMIAAGCVSQPPPKQVLPPARQTTPRAVWPGLRGEMRGIWLSDPRGQDWERVMLELRSAGFNALFVNFATGGAAFYPSAIVPQVSQRDEMTLCVAAARKHRIAVHAKLICFYTYWSPPAFQKQILQQRRELREPDGKPHNVKGFLWLDPAQELNRKHVVALASEILKRYDVDGLQVDYIRFPEIRPVTSYETSSVEYVVSRVRHELHRLRPGKPLSAAVFHDLERARTKMGQDWLAWARRGLVDFLCPMNYTLDMAAFTRMIQTQQAQVKGAAPICVGIRGYELPDPSTVLAQVAAAQRLNPTGFVIFAYSDEFREKLLPKLRFYE